MTITEYKSTTGETMILIIDEENNQGQSMPKSTYDEMIAKQNEANTL